MLRDMDHYLRSTMNIEYDDEEEDEDYLDPDYLNAQALALRQHSQNLGGQNQINTYSIQNDLEDNEQYWYDEDQPLAQQQQSTEIQNERGRRESVVFDYDYEAYSGDEEGDDS